MWLREHGRVFDWGTLRWCQMSSSPPNGCYDVETIALDEFGHVEVLAHHVNYSDDRDYLDAVVQTYSRTKPKEGWDEHALGRCDVATLQRQYDVPTSSTKISTCLDVDTTTRHRQPTATVFGGAVSHGDAEGRRPTATAASRQRPIRPDGQAPAPAARFDDLDALATMTPGRRRARTRRAPTITADAEFRAVLHGDELARA